MSSRGLAGTLRVGTLGLALELEDSWLPRRLRLYGTGVGGLRQLVVELLGAAELVFLAGPHRTADLRRPA